MSVTVGVGIKLTVEGAQEASADLQKPAQDVRHLGQAAREQGSAMAAMGDQIKAVTSQAAALGRQTEAVGVSARQTAAALRILPAQMTDIFTGLASGQSPMTVLIQQGGQLKDSFGGVGNAVRAVGGYLAGLLSPLNLAVAAMAALAIAAYQGHEEVATLNRALIMSGNSAGVTAGQMQLMAQGMASMGTTQGAAVQALAALAQTGKVGADQLKDAAAAAVQWSRATGISVDEVAKDFASLARDPLAATLKLNEGYNYLTESVYRQIRALQASGQQTAAAALAQKAYFDMMQERAPEMRAQMDPLERGWVAIRDAAAKTWDVIKGLWREPLADAQLQSVQARIAAVAQKRNEIGDESAFAPALDRDLAKLREQESVLQSHVRELRRGVELRAQQSEQMRAVISLDDEVKKRLKQTTSGLAQSTSALADLRAQLTAAKERLQALEGLSGQLEKAVPAHERVIKLQYELEGAMSAAARAAKEKELAIAQELERTQQHIEAAERSIQLQRESAEANHQAATARFERADAVEQELQQQREHNATIGLSVEQLAAHKAALDIDRAAMLERRAELLANIGGQDAMVDALRREAQALRDLAVARTDGAQKQAAADAAKKAEEDWKRTADNIERSLTDALMRGFESGKDFGKSMVDALGNQLKAMVADMAFKPLIGAIMGAAGSAANAGGAGQAGGGDVFASLAGVGRAMDGKLQKSFADLQTKLTQITGSASTAAGLTSGAALLGGTVLGSGLSGGKSLVGGRPEATTALGSGLGALAYGGPQGAIYGGALAGLANAAFGMGAKQYADAITQSGIAGVVGGELTKLVGTTTTSRAWTQAGGWFRGDKSGIESTSTTFDGNPLVQQYDAQLLATRTVLQEFASTFGAKGVDAIKPTRNIDTRGLQGAELDKYLSDNYRYMADELLDRSGAWVRNYIEAGETVAAGLARVAQTIGTTADAMAKVGHDALFKTGSIYDSAAGKRVAFQQDPAWVAQTQMQIAQALGGPDGVSKAYSSFFSNMLTEAEQTERKTTMLKQAFAQLGVEMPKTREAFRALVESERVVNSPGTYAGLLKLTDAFAEVVPWADKAAESVNTLSEQTKLLQQALGSLADEQYSLENQLLQLQGKGDAVAARERDRYLAQNTQGLTDAQREQVAAAYDYNRALQAQIDATQAAAQAAQAAAEAQRAVAAERSGLEGQLLQLQGDTAALRARELAALDPANRALQEHVWALQDEQAAAAQAAQAAQEVAAQRSALEVQLLQAQGDTAALRARELAALDPTNRALQEQIWALQDQQAAAAKAAQLADQAAQAWQSAGESMRSEIERIRGVSAGVAGSSYAQTSSAFALATAAARAGDVQAAQSLAGLSQAMLEQAAQVAASREDFLRTAGQTAASLESTLATLGQPAPLASAAAPTAAVLGAPSAGNADAAKTMDDVLKELAALRRELEALRRDNTAENASLAKHVAKTAQVLANVSQDGRALSVVTNAGDALVVEQA